MRRADWNRHKGAVMGKEFRGLTEEELCDLMCGDPEFTCEDCLLDLTDACKRGAGRAVDDSICKDFLANDYFE